MDKFWIKKKNIISKQFGGLNIVLLIRQIVLSIYLIQKTLPKSRIFINQISVRFYETDCFKSAFLKLTVKYEDCNINPCVLS